MKAARLIGVLYAAALTGSLLAYGGVVLAGEIVSEGVVLPSSRVAAVPMPKGACFHPRTQQWEPCGPSKRWIALAWLGQGLDLASTEWVLAHGGVELNPLMKLRAVRWSVKPLLTGGPTWGLSKVPRSAANGIAKSAFWTGFLPGAANAVQAVTRGRQQ